MKRDLLVEQTDLGYHAGQISLQGGAFQPKSSVFPVLTSETVKKYFNSSVAGEGGVIVFSLSVCPVYVHPSIRAEFVNVISQKRFEEFPANFAQMSNLI